MFKIFNHTQLMERRRTLRKNPTKHEYILWNYLKNKNLGFKFNRQYGIGPYIVDFYCGEKKLVIEVDGEIHNFNKEYDKERDVYLSSINLKVLRIENKEVESDISAVLKKVRDCL